MRRVVVGAVVSLALAGCGGGGGGGSPSTPSATPAPAASSTPTPSLPVLNQGSLHETVIAMDPADWQALRDNFRTNQYYSANITFDGEAVSQIGLRSRGVGSRDQIKPALKIDFNKYIASQEYRGYKSLVLKNLVQDASLLRERLAFAVFEAMGIPAPQNSFTRLTVNGEYWGLYQLDEPVSGHFLNLRYGENGGNLFNYQYSYPYDFAWRGGDAGAYIPVPFEPDEDKPDLGAGLVAFVDTINHAPDATFVSTVSSFLDVDRFLTFLAVEDALAEHDGLVGEFGMNNFYLYQFKGQNRFVFIPWDKDNAFQSPAWPIFYNVDTNVLTRRLMVDAGKRKVYVEAVTKAVTSFVNSRWLAPQLESAYSQIRAQAQADTKKPYTNGEFETSVVGLRGIIAGREADVQNQTR